MATLNTCEGHGRKAWRPSSGPGPLCKSSILEAFLARCRIQLSHIVTHMWFRFSSITGTFRTLSREQSVREPAQERLAIQVTHPSHQHTAAKTVENGGQRCHRIEGPAAFRLAAGPGRRPGSAVTVRVTVARARARAASEAPACRRPRPQPTGSPGDESRPAD
jgi:hypothetical protein